jgi:peptidoglycan hydrolase-like protein with peptidoglycan-binding domain
LDRYYRKQHSRLSNETKLLFKGKKKNRGLIAVSTQSALKKLGYDAEPLDGIIGPKTRAAIRLFQLNKGLKTDGIFGDLTAKALLPYVSSSSQLEGKLTIIDGDTFYADGEKIRIYGFNAPELEELGGYLAKLRLESLLSSGIVTIERKSKDKYGRTIAKVKINGIDLVSLLEPY